MFAWRRRRHAPWLTLLGLLPACVGAIDTVDADSATREAPATDAGVLDRDAGAFDAGEPDAGMGVADASGALDAGLLLDANDAPLEGVEVRPGDDFATRFSAALEHSPPTLILAEAGIYTVNDSIWGGGSGRSEDGVTVVAAVPGAIVEGRTDDRFLYVSGDDWTLRGFEIRGYRPYDSGVIGIVGTASRFTMEDMTMRGSGGLDPNSHLVYFAGTGTGHRIVRSRLLDAPGAAYHSYRGAPVVMMADTELSALYIPALLWSGTHAITRVMFVAPPTPTGHDVDFEGVHLTIRDCTTLTGRGVTGSGVIDTDGSI